MKYLNQLAEWIAFSPLGIGLGILFGCSLMYVLLRPSHIEPQPQVLVTVQPTVVRVPTQLPPTPEPTPEPTLEPTARPVGANYIVVAGDSMINIVKNVCRELGYELWDQYLIADLADMNINHNRQYIGNVMQPGEELGIGCVLP